MFLCVVASSDCGSMELETTDSPVYVGFIEFTQGPPPLKPFYTCGCLPSDQYWSQFEGKEDNRRLIKVSEDPIEAIAHASAMLRALATNKFLPACAGGEEK